LVNLSAMSIIYFINQKLVFFDWYNLILSITKLLFLYKLTHNPLYICKLNKTAFHGTSFNQTLQPNL
jgi:hypothetical protein